jgi:ATP-dependent DNA helicase DinG
LGDRKNEVKHHMKNRFVVVDVETTGNAPKKGDKIIQIAAVLIENGIIIERFSSFVNPGCEIPPFIEQFTGISNQMVEDQPSFHEIAPKIISMLKDSYFVAHNVFFDLSFIQEELCNCGYPPLDLPTIDTVELARMLLPTNHGYKLAQLVESFSIENHHPHKADSDAEVTAEIFLRLLKKLEDLPLVTLRQLAKLSLSLISDLHEYIQSIIERKLTSVSDEKQRFDIFRGIALKKDEKSSADTHVLESSIDFYQFFDDIQNNPSLLMKSMKNYMPRHGQLKMISTVFEALHTHQHAMIEAGTGIGKTFAYLLPAVFFAKKEKKPVIISTYSIQQQQQILENTIPIIRNIVPFPFNVCLLKGKEHYLSLQKFAQVLYEEEDNYDSILTKAQILVWLTETNTGDKDELHLPSGGNLFWDKVKVDDHTLNNHTSPWQSRCFYRKAQKRAMEADIVVTNHSLLFADLNAAHHVLPNYHEVIIDEAHHLEKVASSYFGVQIHYLQLHFLLQKTENLLVKMLKRLKAKKELKRWVNEAIQLVKMMKPDMDELFRCIHQYVRSQSNVKESTRISYRYHVMNENGAEWNAIIEATEKLHFRINECTRLIERGLEQTKRVLENEISEMGELLEILTTYHRIAEHIEFLFFESHNDHVTWFEIEPKGAQNAAYVYSQPIEISELLANQLFTEKKSVILTSATLTTNHSFQYMINRLGLEDFYPICLSIPSPFLYKEQVKFMIPSDMPLINKVSMDDYVAVMSKHLAEIIRTMNGKTLILFTSYEMLKMTYSQLKDNEKLNEFILLAQGGGSSGKLLKQFIHNERTVLLGTSSFWEGLDLPGDQLNCLIIVRLPFPSPDEPVLSAKSENIRARGGNPFIELSLPEAIIRFKQGFGRLIRSESDKGVIFVFDRRITSTEYGKNFIISLPEIEIIEQPMKQLLEVLRSWM